MDDNSTICSCCERKRATAEDLDAWYEREFCYRNGDCSCPICIKICWMRSAQDCEEEQKCH